MTTLSMPTTPGFIKQSWGQTANTQSAQSPLTKSVQTLNLTGARWHATYTLPPMKIADAAAWMAFLVQLEGQSGRFYGVPPNSTPRGGVTGFTQVNGAGQTGTSLAVKALPLNMTNVFRSGDFISFNNELKMVCSDANSDGSGHATLSIFPALRGSPSDSANVTYNNPVVTMMLTSDDQAQWDRDVLRLYGITFAGVEVWGS